ncbi:MAG: hypothetical protein HY939_02675 [Gammaproteobacteria bacterium]|nr:hypothetical protein [Gammaproteobacteria bacterium]
MQKLEKEDRELTGFKNLIDCYRVLKKYDCRDENAKRFLSQEIQEDILMSIIKWHHLLVKKLDINQLIELTKTESVIEKIKNSISFLDVVSQLGHTEEQIEKFFLFNYENKPFPDEFKRIHGVLIKSGFTLEKLTSYFVLFSTMDERMAYFQELETLFLNLPGFINATILMDTLKTDDGLQKVRYFFSLYKIISELGYEEKQIEIIMFKLSAEERDSLLRLHPHVRLKLNHIEILDLFLLPENRKKWKHLDEFLAEIKGCSYPEECIKPLFLLGYDYDVLSSKEFKELDSGFDINGFKFKDRMACFEYYLKKDDDIFYLKIFVELLPFLLGFFSHSEIMARLIKDNNTIEEFQNIIKFRATLLKLGYVNERQKEMLEANCENKLFPDDFERIHRVLRENRFTLDDILDCFKLFSTMDERAVLFQELERIATNLPDFIRPSFVVEILKTESGLEKLQYISLHYKEKVSRAYTNNEIKILLIKFKKDFFEDLINYYDHLMRVIMDRQQLFFLIDSSVGIEKIRDLIAFVKITSALGYDEDKQRRLLMLNREAKLSADKFKSAHEILFSRGFNHERMMFCFALYKTERENWHHLTELAENVEILFQFFGADKIFNILKTPDGFLKLHFLTACEKNESKKGWIIASLQHIERMALDTQDVNQFAKNLRISFEASLDASSDSANPIPELSDRDRAMTPDNPSSSVYAMLQVLRSSTPPVVSMLLGDEESEHQCALPPDPSQPQATTSSEEDVFQGLEQMGIFFGNRIL